MSTFREFQTGLQLGMQQRKVRADDKARADASALFDSGVYEGAQSTLMKAGLADEANAFGQAGERRKKQEDIKAQGDAFKGAGGGKPGYQAVSKEAGSQGDFSTAAALDEHISKMDDEDKAHAAQRAQFFAQTAYGLSQIKDPAQRKAALDEIVQTSGPAVGVTPEMAANFKLDVVSLHATYQSSMTLAQQLQANKPEMLAPGAIMASPEGKTIASNPKDTNLQSVKGADGFFYNFDPSKGTYTKSDTQAPASSGIVVGPDGTVTIGGPADKAAAQAFGKSVGSDSADRMKAVHTAADAARTKKNTLDELKLTLSHVGYQGFGGQTIQQLSKIGRGLGIPIGEDVPAAEAANMIRAGLALAMKSDLPGPMSNADREFLLSIPPNISNTAAGNQAIMFILEKRAQMAIDMDASLRAAAPKGPDDYQKWENGWVAKQNAKPYFDQATAAKLREALGS